MSNKCEKRSINNNVKNLVSLSENFLRNPNIARLCQTSRVNLSIDNYDREFRNPWDSSRKSSFGSDWELRFVLGFNIPSCFSAFILDRTSGKGSQAYNTNYACHATCLFDLIDKLSSYLTLTKILTFSGHCLILRSATGETCYGATKNCLSTCCQNVQQTKKGIQVLVTLRWNRNALRVSSKNFQFIPRR